MLERTSLDKRIGGKINRDGERYGFSRGQELRASRRVLNRSGIES